MPTDPRPPTTLRPPNLEPVKAPHEDLPTDHTLVLKVIPMPSDANANGDIFGGWVMSRMDQAGGIDGVDQAQGRVVTIAVEAMTFIRPVKVGDVLSVYTTVVSVGRTSMKIYVEAWAKRFRTTIHEKVTDATFTFVAIDEEGRPRPVPKLES